MRWMLLGLSLLLIAALPAVAEMCPNGHEVEKQVCTTCGAEHSGAGWKYESADLKSFKNAISERVTSFVKSAPGEPMEAPVYYQQLSEGLKVESEGVRYFVIAPKEKVKGAVDAWLTSTGTTAKYDEVALLKGPNPAYVMTWNSNKPDVLVIVNYRTDDGLARIALTISE